jgi:molybdopterin-guanine dinucleotide biosynthesis protein B
MHDGRGAAAPTLDAILSRLGTSDIVLVEGYKREAHSKIETRRLGAKDQAPLSANDPHIVAIAADFAIAGESLPVFDLNDTTSIADFIERTTGLRR